MTSKLVIDRLHAAGLAALLDAREHGEVPDATLCARVSDADTLLLGAAADVARRRELGDEAIVYVPYPPPSDASTVLCALTGEGGTAFLRRVASLRLTGPVGIKIVVQWTELGLETAQLALSFGASGLTGPIASKRGLPMAESDAQRALVKRGEISAYVERAGYRARFVNTKAPANDEPVRREVTQSAHATQGNVHVGS